MDYIDVLKDNTLKALLCDEEFCDCYRYNIADSIIKSSN
jgi:hypothetical protein